MAVLTYNGVEITFARTMFWDSKNVPSSDGVDYLYTHVTLSVVGIVNPYTLKNQNSSVLPGDRLGGMMKADLKEVLMAKRKHLTFKVGNDIVIDIPTGSAPCDCNNGPNPISAKILQITGDKTALVAYTIETWLSDCSNMLLSNRWSVQSLTDENARTTRHITGVARLRADFMQLAKFNADDFRGSYFPPCPQQFQREMISASLSSDGTQLAYRVQDTELNLAIGSDGVGGRNVTKVEGAVTGGIKVLNSTRVGQALVTAFFKGALGPFGFSKTADFAADKINRVSVPMAKCVVRVTGNRLALKGDLVDVAGAVALERLFPNNDANFGNIFASTVMASAFLTQSIEDRFVELTMEVMPSVGSQVATSFNLLNFAPLMDLDTNVIGTFNGVTLNFLSGNAASLLGNGPVMLGSSNDRGTWIGALLVQALGINCQLPSTVPPNKNWFDLPPE